MVVSAWAARAAIHRDHAAPFHMYQPKNGIHVSSRLTMKVGAANSGSSPKASHID